MMRYTMVWAPQTHAHILGLIHRTNVFHPEYHSYSRFWEMRYYIYINQDTLYTADRNLNWHRHYEK